MQEGNKNKTTGCVVLTSVLLVAMFIAFMADTCEQVVKEVATHKQKTDTINTINTAKTIYTEPLKRSR